MSRVGPPRGFSERSPRLSPGGTAVVLTGLAGAGKTAVLEALEAAGEQVLHLERLAGHRGSAFGGLGCEPQPSHAQFQRSVLAALAAAADPGAALWMEDEGPFIGSVGVPPAVQELAARAPAVELRAPFAVRVQRIATAYEGCDEPALLAALARKAPRLGEPTAAAAEKHVRRGEIARAVELLLPFYDAAYRHRASAAPRRVVAGVAVDHAGAPSPEVVEAVRGALPAHRVQLVVNPLH